MGREIPILMSGPLVRATLEGAKPEYARSYPAKTQTRRPIKQGVKMRLIIIHVVVWALVMLATTPEGDCTRSGDCERGYYCKSGTCVPKEAK